MDNKQLDKDTRERVEQALSNNPHFIKMAEILETRPDLLTQIEAGDKEAIKELSGLAYEYFLLMLVRLDSGDKAYKTVKQAICERIHRRLNSTVKP